MSTEWAAWRRTMTECSQMILTITSLWFVNVPGKWRLWHGTFRFWRWMARLQVIFFLSAGGTYGHIHAAVQELRAEGHDVSFAHFDFIDPLPSNTAEVFAGFRKIIVCELNTGQFAAYLRTMVPGHEYLQCNKVQGQTFLVRDIVKSVTEKA